MKQNITLSLEKKLIQQAKILAAKRSTSISAMISKSLKAEVNRNREYGLAKRKALQALENGLPLSGKPASRDELHERL